MYALPPDLQPGSGNRVSGITCPSCHGSLEVRAEGSAHLHFTCRVGHTFSLREVLTALEHFLEDTIWSAVRGSEEMAALLQDVIAYRSTLPDIGPDATYAQRRLRAANQAAALRALVARDEPLVFTEDISGAEAEDAGEIP
jgi:two-component system, chemotaxis family, protein-glutamate methylesterase/glutaminase